MNTSNANIWDVFKLILGLFLCFSPWLFSFEAGRLSQNAYATGIVIVVLSLAALLAYAPWEEWINLLAGLWAIASPWVLGFSGNTTATNVHVIAGILVAIFAGVEVVRGPPEHPAVR